MKRWQRMLVVGGAAVAVSGGVAWAAIPDGSGQIHGCYKNGNGDLRVIDPSAGGACKASESPLAWSQTGPAGPPGAAGATHVTIRTFTATLPAAGSSTFTALCNPGEVATGGGWRMDGPVPSGPPPVTVLGTVPQSSAPEPSAGETPIGWKVVGAASQDGAPHDVTAFATCAAP